MLEVVNLCPVFVVVTAFTALFLDHRVVLAFVRILVAPLTRKVREMVGNHSVSCFDLVGARDHLGLLVTGFARRRKVSTFQRKLGLAVCLYSKQ